MNRQILILEELGLLPLWVRHELADPEPQLSESPPPAVHVHSAPSTPTLVNKPRPLADLLANPAPSPVTIPPPPSKPQEDSRLRALRINSLDWAALNQEITQCQACSLCNERRQAVIGGGDREADWVVVGEAPGSEEDMQGEPFVGQSGKLLDAMLASVGRSRKQGVYILNTVKCRPPQNRNPNAAELAACAPLLKRQITLLQPKLILAMGRFAATQLTASDAPLASLRGHIHQYRQIPVVISYHPAYLLRNLPAKYDAWCDLLLAQSVLTAPPPP